MGIKKSRAQSSSGCEWIENQWGKIGEDRTLWEGGGNGTSIYIYQ